MATPQKQTYFRKPLVCRECGTDEDLFVRTSGYIERICRACMRENRRKDRAMPGYREAERAKLNAYRAANREKCRKQNRRHQKKLRQRPLPGSLIIGAAVAAWRKANGITQPQLGQVIGLHVSSVYKREHGLTAWKPHEQRALAALGVEW